MKVSSNSFYFDQSLLHTDIFFFFHFLLILPNRYKEALLGAVLKNVCYCLRLQALESHTESHFKRNCKGTKIALKHEEVSVQKAYGAPILITYFH